MGPSTNKILLATTSETKKYIDFSNIGRERDLSESPLMVQLLSFQAPEAEYRDSRRGHPPERSFPHPSSLFREGERSCIFEGSGRGLDKLVQGLYRPSPHRRSAAERSFKIVIKIKHAGKLDIFPK